MEVSERIWKVQDLRLSIIDVSSADDSLIDPISGNSEDHHRSENQDNAELLCIPKSKQFMDAAEKLEEWKQVSQPNESLEIVKTKKNSKCNLRKSLAWDSAFFTSAGVLDPEELYSIIEGVEKEENLALPGIQEVYKSCESISTLGSDSLTLESIEAELFEDIRAPIQESTKKSNAANRERSGITKFQTGKSLQKVGMTSPSEIKMKAPLVSKNPNASIQGSGKMTKKNPISPQVSQKLVAKRGESSISRQSKEPDKTIPISTISVKRAPLGGRHIRSEKDMEKRISSVSSVPKASVVGSSRGIVPKPTLSSKSSSGSSVTTKTKSATSASSGSNASENIIKPFNSLKRKGAGTVKQPASGSSGIPSRNKTQPGNFSLSGLMSVTKLSPSVLPASSISDWSSESSSTSIAKVMSSSSRASLDSSSCRNVSSDVDTSEASNSESLPSDSSLEEHEIQITGTKCAKTTSTRTILPPAHMKSSGLRLPSPKIGYFDGMKSLVRTPRGVLQSNSVVTRGLPKHDAGSARASEVQNKLNVGKLQPARSIMSVEDTEPNNQHISCPIPLHGSSVVALQDIKNSSEIPVEVENKMLYKTDADNLKANETKAEEHLTIHDLDPFSAENYGQLDISIDKEVLDISIDKVSPEENKGGDLENSAAAFTDGDHDTSFSSATDNVENTLFHAEDKEPTDCQVANNQGGCHYDNEVDCLIREFRFMSI